MLFLVISEPRPERPVQRHRRAAKLLDLDPAPDRQGRGPFGSRQGWPRRGGAVRRALQRGVARPPERLGRHHPGAGSGARPDRSRKRKAVPRGASGVATHMPTLDVAAGSILAYRLFDVAYAIDLGQGRGNMGTHRPHRKFPRAADHHARQGGGLRRAAGRPRPRHHHAAPAGRSAVPATVTARLYEFGVVSIALRVPVTDLSWSAFSDRAQCSRSGCRPGPGHRSVD